MTCLPACLPAAVPAPLQAYDYESNGSHRLLGWVEASTDKLQQMAGSPGQFLQLQAPPGRPASGSYGSLEVGLSRYIGISKPYRRATASIYL